MGSFDRKIQDEFHYRNSITNAERAGMFALVVLFINIFCLISDYYNFKHGFWSKVPAYRYLFYAHMIFVVGLFISYISLKIINLYMAEKSRNVQVKWYSTYAFLTILYTLCMSVVISGGIDQLLHYQITIYVLAIFAVSTLFIFRPYVYAFLYGISYILFVIILFHYQSNPALLKGNFMNGSAMIILGWFFASALYYSREREFSYLLNLEKRVETEVLAKMKEQEKAFFLAAIVESTSDAIVGVNSEGIINYWNPSSEKMFGYKAKEVIGKPYVQVLGIDHEKEVKANIKLALKGGKISLFETQRFQKDGHFLDVSITSSPIMDFQGRIIGVSAIIRDISDIKKVEREIFRLDRLNVVGEMAASISHEVRNPMTTVKGYLQYLSEKEEMAKFQSYFDLMIEELDRANSILTEFLSISRTKATMKERQNLNSIIKTILPLIEANAVQNNITVKTDLQETPDLMLDGKEIRQVIINLSKNAIEAMDEGKVLTIRTFVNGEEVVLEVEDQGKGISPEVLEKLGTPFFTTKDTGTGLGLAVCNSILERHGAKMEVDSDENGTTFRVIFY